VSRWVHSLPATCAFSRPFESYWVGTVLLHDEDQFPSNTMSEWVRHGAHGELFASRIRAYYDPAHRIAAYVESGTDISNFAAIADAAPPPAGVTTPLDLSAVQLGGNVHLGDTLAHVASAVGLKSLHPTPAAGACQGYSVVGFCSWNVKACECPTGNYLSDKRLGMVVFRAGRVVALAWDDGACGFG